MTKKTKAIQESLLAQLKAKNADTEAFIALVQDYIFFAEQLEEMKKDIRKNGRVIESVSSVGKEYTRENPAVANSLRYSQQMLKILSQLGLSVDNVVTEAADEDADI